MNHARKNFEDASRAIGHSHELIKRLVFRTDFLQLLDEASVGHYVPERIDRLLEALEETRRSRSLAVALDASFSIKIQRRLASSVPPRPMVASTSNDALSFLGRFLLDIPAAAEMLGVSSATDLHTAFWTFLSQLPTPCVYVRSLMQSFLTLHDKMMGHTHLHDFVVDDMRALVLPASILLDSPVENPADPLFQIGTQIAEFVQKVAPSFQNQFRSFALNRSRVRRNLCHAAVEWDNIQAEAEEMDGYLQTLTSETPLSYGPSEDPAFAYSLSSWIYHHKLMHLRLLIQMGFELDIYESAEYVDMYWYLSHVAGLHLSHLERISYFIAQAKLLPHWTSDDHRRETQKALSLLYRHFTLLKAVDTLANALQRIFVILARHGHLTRQGSTYATDELRHEVRMRPFQNLSVPEPIPCVELKSMSRLETLSDGEVLDQASRLVLASRKAWDQVLKDPWNPHLASSEKSGIQGSVLQREWTLNVKNSMKACIGASIAIITLTKALNEGSATSRAVKGHNDALAALHVTVPSPEASNRLHRWWAVPNIVK